MGSFKKGTILAGHKTADIVLIIKHLPAKEDITKCMVGFSVSSFVSVNCCS